MMLRVTGEADFPVRIVSLRRSQLAQTPRQLIERALELRAASTDRLRLGIVKIVVDGSIQGFSARLRWPGLLQRRAERALVRGAGAVARDRSRLRSTPACRSTRTPTATRRPSWCSTAMEEALREASARATIASRSSTASSRMRRSSGA